MSSVTGLDPNPGSPQPSQNCAVTQASTSSNSERTESAKPSDDQCQEVKEPTRVPQKKKGPLGSRITREEETIIFRLCKSNEAAHREGTASEFWAKVSQELSTHRQGRTYRVDSCARRVKGHVTQRREEVANAHDSTTDEWTQALDAWIAVVDAHRAEKADVKSKSSKTKPANRARGRLPKQNLKVAESRAEAAPKHEECEAIAEREQPAQAVSTTTCKRKKAAYESSAADSHTKKVKWVHTPQTCELTTPQPTRPVRKYGARHLPVQPATSLTLWPAAETVEAAIIALNSPPASSSSSSSTRNPPKSKKRTALADSTQLVRKKSRTRLGATSLAELEAEINQAFISGTLAPAEMPKLGLEVLANRNETGGASTKPIDPAAAAGATGGEKRNGRKKNKKKTIKKKPKIGSFAEWSGRASLVLK